MDDGYAREKRRLATLFIAYEHDFDHFGVHCVQCWFYLSRKLHVDMREWLRGGKSRSVHTLAQARVIELVVAQLGD